MELKVGLRCIDKKALPAIKIKKSGNLTAVACSPKKLSLFPLGRSLGLGITEVTRECPQNFISHFPCVWG